MNEEDPISLDAPYAFGEAKYSRLQEQLQARKVQSILEFGSGRTTARFCRDYPQARILSVDNSPRFLEETRELCASLHGGTAQPDLLHLPLRWQNRWNRLFLSYALADVPDAIRTRMFDLCLIDGPVQQHTLGGREFVLYPVFPYLCRGAVLVLDDAHRADSRKTIANWLRVFGPALQIVDDQTNMVILEKTRDVPGPHPLGAKGWFQHHRGILRVLYKQCTRRNQA